MSKKTLNLHIGSPKTGSTSIQEIFAKNRQNLRYQGFNYPGKNLDHHFLYFASKAPRESWPRHFKGIEESKLRAYLIKYFKELEEGFQHEEKIIISTEYIFFSDKEMVENIISYLRRFFDEIKIFCFLREPINYYKSSQQQLIKGQSYIKSPATFCYDFKKVLKIWGELADDVVALDFDKNDNSFLRLCNKMRIDPKGFRHVDHRTKSSVSIEQMLLFEKIYKNIYLKYDDQLSGKLHVKTIAQINTNHTNKPELNSGVDSIIYRNHREDLLWLKNIYGINYINQKYEDNSSEKILSFDGDKTTVRDVFKVPNEQLVEKYEAHIIDLLLKKLVRQAS